MGELYPPIEPYDTGYLDVGDGHELYWEAVGNPTGVPAAFLHGGPGTGCSAGHRRWFDPAAYRVILFDQRGSGRSRPLADSAAAELSTNTTQHLVRDIELLRTQLGIDSWVVVGGSWGVTLALTYAQHHPQRVSALVLCAVTAGRRLETDWITRDMRRVFPREWDRFADHVPSEERNGDLSAAYAKLLADPDTADNAARRWCEWEDTHVSLMPGWEPRLTLEESSFQQVFARLVTHYWSNGCFLDDEPILEAMPRIAHIPAALVHGRYDVSGPLDTAWDLHRAWPASRLTVVDDAGHGGGSMGSAVVDACDGFARLLSTDGRA